MIPGNLPSKFIDFSISLNGQGYLGRCNYIELPKLKKKTEEKRYAGSQSPVKEFVGYEAMEAKISFPCFVKEVYQMFAIDGRTAVITARGAYKAQEGIAQPCVVVIGGKFDEIDPGKWQSGEINEFTVSIDVRLLSISYAGEQVMSIDAHNSISSIGGVVDSNLDVNKSIRMI